MKYIYLLLILFSFQSVNAQYKIEVLDSNTFILGDGVVLSKISFRGLSVVDDKTIWVSGSRGTIARSIDGGKTFHYNQIKGYEKSDFRDIEAFDDNRAIIMSSGTPAYILKTIDGGKTWKEVYKNFDTAYFLDAMDFWDEQRGILVGDPIHKHFLLLQTNDGGETWQELDTTKTPIAFDGEAVFAASGTSLRCWGKDEFGFVSGGESSFLYNKRIGDIRYKKIKLKFNHGKSSEGSFSFVVLNHSKFAVGGDYLKKEMTVGNFDEIGIDIHHEDMPNYMGYLSCIDCLDTKSIIMCGTNGVFMRDFHFKDLSSEPFNVVRKAKKGKAVFLAGPKGKIGKLIY